MPVPGGPSRDSATDLALDLDVIVEAEVPPDLDLDALRDLVGFVLRSEGVTGSWAVAVVLTDDERLRALHRDYLGVDAPTDVMTFPLGEAAPGSSAAGGGDVVVSVERAQEQAAEFGNTPAQEVCFLVVHGLLHLCGWDDATDDERARMLERQAALLAAFAPPHR